MGKILIIGACGQLGTELTGALRLQHGNDKIVAADVAEPQESLLAGPFEKLNVMDRQQLGDVVSRHGVSKIYHLAAVLSAKGEANPHFAWDLNMTSLLNVLELARERNLDQIYWPSSIAVFGPSTPKDRTPQHTIMDPTTVYGISKLAGERWCEYYFLKYGVDVRSIRYPGLIGYKAKPGGGTTDYAVDIFHKAIEGKSYECFLRKDTYLPMMYMNDAVSGTIQLMDTGADHLTIRSGYNMGAMSFSPADIYEAILPHFPDFQISYHPDFRQTIADSWPKSLDDSQARNDWGWQHAFELPNMTSDIIHNLVAN